MNKLFNRFLLLAASAKYEKSTVRNYTKFSYSANGKLSWHYVLSLCPAKGVNSRQIGRQPRPKRV